MCVGGMVSTNLKAFDERAILSSIVSRQARRYLRLVDKSTDVNAQVDTLATHSRRLHGQATRRWWLLRDKGAVTSTCCITDGESLTLVQYALHISGASRDNGRPAPATPLRRRREGTFGLLKE
jgi:hypothetical protein